jgi:NarL family two-component system sensor histidine kinase LiaS
MIHRLFAELRRLRWKLALAYTVTTASVLMVLLILLVAIAFAVGGSREEQARVVMGVLGQIAARVAPAMAGDPVDSVRLSVLLTILLERSGINTAGATANVIISTADSPDIELSHAGEIYILALDTQGRLVGSTLLDDRRVIGRPFDLAALPGLGDLLAGDLSQRPFVIDWAIGRGIAAVPVMGSRRLGTLVYVANGLNSQPFDPLAILAQFGGLIGTFTAAAALVGMAFGLFTAHGLTRRLRRIEQVTAAWGNGDFVPRLADRSADEIGQLSRQLNGVADQIASLIRERQQFASLEERNRLARDLHDSVKQHVFAVSMSLGAAQELWPEDVAAAAVLTQRAAAATAQAQHELTGIIDALRPMALERVGLAQALRDMASDWSAQAGIAVAAEIAFEGGLAPTVEQALFRIAQEALANVSRHSGARSAALSLRVINGGLVLAVRDDGHGFELGTARAGMGLRSMRERAEAVGATFHIYSDRLGTELRVSLPE